jgi:hypothetical protein
MTAAMGGTEGPMTIPVVAMPHGVVPTLFAQPSLAPAAPPS